LLLLPAVKGRLQETAVLQEFLLLPWHLLNCTVIPAIACLLRKHNLKLLPGCRCSRLPLLPFAASAKIFFNTDIALLSCNQLLIAQMPPRSQPIATTTS
jgi:hypothetical protein